MPTDEQRALWAAIRAHPDDDTPRLVYADWLQENGDEARAEFIRVQCALAKLPADRRKNRKERPALEARERELLAAHREEWAAAYLGVMNQAPRLSSPGFGFLWDERVLFRRGFLQVDAIALERARALSAADALEPLETVHVFASRSDYRDADLDAFAQWAGSNGVRHLSIDGATNDSLTAITRHGHFRSLSHLELHGSISDSGMRELARWPLATALRVLNFRGNPITHTGAFVLAECPYLDNLARLDLTDTRITAYGRERLRERFGHRVHFTPEVV